MFVNEFLTAFSTKVTSLALDIVLIGYFAVETIPARDIGFRMRDWSMDFPFFVKTDYSHHFKMLHSVWEILTVLLVFRFCLGESTTTICGTFVRVHRLHHSSSRRQGV